MAAALVPLLRRGGARVRLVSADLERHSERRIDERWSQSGHCSSLTADARPNFKASKVITSTTFLLFPPQNCVLVLLSRAAPKLRRLTLHAIGLPDPLYAK
eukprot:TRINITY_DN3159_c0_g1_i1.p2 TRINITY_DN3159_c0_g1~~TRINITY_DN3159_c0_g1_i1.p2  ORF type:complete len:101 (+),score=3.34 TRINITY_DN3159_c0_g1_i1:403-705(+)